MQNHQSYKGVDHFIGGGGWEPFIIPNVDHFSITYLPSHAFPDDFQIHVNASPSIGGIATNFFAENICGWEAFAFENSRDQGLWINEDSPCLFG